MNKLTKLDIIVICSLFLIGLSTYKLASTSGIKKLKLLHHSQTEYLGFNNQTYNLNDRYKTDLIIEVKDNAARILHSSCLGKQCIRTGWISQCGESAICLPNKTAIVIECEEQDIDAVSQ